MSTSNHNKDLEKPPVNEVARIVHSCLLNDLGLDRTGVAKKLIPQIEAYIKANYLPKQDIEKAIGEDEIKDTAGKYNDRQLHRDSLRAQIRTALGLNKETK